MNFVKKEFMHILRDKRTILILFGIPVMQIVLFGFALSTEVKNIRVAIHAPVYDATVGRIADRLDASPYFIFVGLLASPDEIDGAFRSGAADFVVSFSPSFADRMFSPEGSQVQLITDATDTNAAASVAMYATSIMQHFLSENFPQQSACGVSTNVRMLYNPQMKSAYTFVPGLMGLIMILICAMMTSISIVREKETGTMEVLLVSPARPVYIILSKMTPYIALSCLNFAVILLLSVFLLGVPMAGSLTCLCALSLLYIIVSLALGLLISTIVETQIAAMLVSGMVLMMPSIFLSGMMFPIESMPWILQQLSCIIPARWYIEAVKKLMIEGLPARYVVREFAILFGMAAFMIGVSLATFKRRLQ